jgi:cytochrome c553
MPQVAGSEAIASGRPAEPVNRRVANHLMAVRRDRSASDGVFTFLMTIFFPMNPIQPFSRICISSLALLTVLFTTPSVADEVDAGREKAQSCAVCHGNNGLAQMPGAPNLAGQSAMYLVEQLKNFRSGKRSNEIMNVIAKPLSDADINNLAAWYASIQIEVRQK